MLDPLEDTFCDHVRADNLKEVTSFSCLCDNLPSESPQQKKKCHYREYADHMGDESTRKQVFKEDALHATPARKEQNFTKDYNEYYEERERLKEIERQRFRRTDGNGKSSSQPARKHLPSDNYGSFFGPSILIISRRIISDIRARETTSKLGTRQPQEVLDVC
ncbi:hypothetical protein KP509_15G011700 [Ceratopteris richardii]|uniref:Uncharacterized protein n=1 Tax=Ceratopteris richardii TaxID=49495 RepID=A0A8T2T114_CERRI|nr:hypothetical protein KP509_15G011700 [Ceratopteris richardii]